MNKYITPVRVQQWTKTAVAVAEAVPAAGSALWVDLRTTGNTRRGGVTLTRNAVFPNLDIYDGLRIEFGPGGATSGVAQVLAIDVEGNVRILGQSTFQVGMGYPPVEVPVQYVKYAVILSAVGAATTVNVFAAPFYRTADL